MTYIYYLVLVLHLHQPNKIKYEYQQMEMASLQDCVDVMVTFHEQPFIIDKYTEIKNVDCKIVKEEPRPEIEVMIQLPSKENV